MYQQNMQLLNYIKLSVVYILWLSEIVFLGKMKLQFTGKIHKYP